jgi:pyruvate dehydrogenase E1 component alpha subunit
MNFSKQELIKLYRNMERGRRFNEAIVELCKEADLSQMWTSGVGLEGVEAGAASFLEREDWIWSTYRSITASLSKGLDPRIWLKNNLSRKNNTHFGNTRKSSSTRDHGNTPVKQKDTFSRLEIIKSHKAVNGIGVGGVIVYLFGDSSVRSSELVGWIEESCKSKLPIVWVYMIKPGSPMFTSEDIGSCISRTLSSNGYRLLEISIDGRDAIAVARSVRTTLDRARSGVGPALIKARLFRANGYPNRSILNQYKAGENGRSRDPVNELRKGLLNRRVATVQELRGLEADIASEVSEVFNWALRSFVR